MAKNRRHDIVKSSKFKTSMCTFFRSPAGCPFEDRCAFAHGEDDLREECKNNELHGVKNSSKGDGMALGVAVATAATPSPVIPTKVANSTTGQPLPPRAGMDGGHGQPLHHPNGSTHPRKGGSGMLSSDSGLGCPPQGGLHSTNTNHLFTRQGRRNNISNVCPSGVKESPVDMCHMKMMSPYGPSVVPQSPMYIFSGPDPHTFYHVNTSSALNAEVHPQTLLGASYTAMSALQPGPMYSDTAVSLAMGSAVGPLNPHPDTFMNESGVRRSRAMQPTHVSHHPEELTAPHLLPQRLYDSNHDDGSVAHANGVLANPSTLMPCTMTIGGDSGNLSLQSLMSSTAPPTVVHVPMAHSMRPDGAAGLGLWEAFVSHNSDSNKFTPSPWLGMLSSDCDCGGFPATAAPLTPAVTSESSNSHHLSGTAAALGASVLTPVLGAGLLTTAAGEDEEADFNGFIKRWLQQKELTEAVTPTSVAAVAVPSSTAAYKESATTGPAETAAKGDEPPPPPANGGTTEVPYFRPATDSVKLALPRSCVLEEEQTATTRLAKPAADVADGKPSPPHRRVICQVSRPRSGNCGQTAAVVTTTCEPTTAAGAVKMPRPRRVVSQNHFHSSCVAKEPTPGAGDALWLYWAEKNTLFYITGQAGGEAPTKASAAAGGVEERPKGSGEADDRWNGLGHPPRGRSAEASGSGHGDVHDLSGAEYCI